MVIAGHVAGAVRRFGCGQSGRGHGGTFTASGAGKLFDEVLHWNGRKWGTVTVPSPGTLDAGSVSSRLNAPVVHVSAQVPGGGLGHRDVGYLNETLHLRDGKWRTAPVPSPSSGQDAQRRLVQR